MVSYGLLSSFGTDSPPELRPKTSHGPKKRKERTRTMSKIAKQGAILESEVDSRPRGKRTPPRLAASAGSSSTRFLLSTPPKRCIDSSPPSPENTPPNFGAWNPIQSTDLASPRGAGKRGLTNLGNTCFMT
mmetsp:Transcript_114/g.300  ORF Transcript_114/g.300 Transcript_114/m.300 type:complete len:131 (-) Transcript_114:4-396(-)